MRVTARYCVIVLMLASLAATQTAEQKTARYLDSIRQQPSLLLAFLHDMPKGGDLHNHLGGAVYAEDLIDFAASDNFCIDRTTSQLAQPAVRLLRKVQAESGDSLRLRGPRSLQPDH